MSVDSVTRDERTVAIENASFRWSYMLLSFGILGSVVYRSFVVHEAAWDLLALVVAGGVVNAVNQGRERILSRRWAMASVAAALMALALAVVLAMMTTP